MKYAKTITQYIEVDAIRVDVPVRDEEERDFLKDQEFPFLKDGRIQLVLDLTTKKVRDWPEGRTAAIHTKVCDEGSYYLLAGDEVVAEVVENYVPGVMPGDHYGDYLLLSIEEDGAVNGWSQSRVERRLQEFGS